MSERAPAAADWLSLREPADADARSAELVEVLRRSLPADDVRVHDLGSGTGSMARWLAPLLDGRQHWVLTDQDTALLAATDDSPPAHSRDHCPVTVETRRRDVTRLAVDDLAGADLVTASALLDVLSAEELDRLVASCAAVGCPVLFTLTVTGDVDLDPPDPLDTAVGAAFNAHQRRATGVGALLGPTASWAAAAAFTRLGREVLTRPSPWHLGSEHAELISQWYAGWLGAACLAAPELAGSADGYDRRPRDKAAAGSLGVTVHHEDLPVLPEGGGAS